MKIRNGFVSNSSTSSFAVYGVVINEFQSFYEKITGKKAKKLTKLIELGCDDGEIYDLSKNMAEEIEKVLKKKDIVLELVLAEGSEAFDPDGAFIIGRDLDEVNGQEDLLTTLAVAKDKLEKIMGKEDVKPQFYYGEIYN